MPALAEETRDTGEASDPSRVVSGILDFVSPPKRVVERDDSILVPKLSVDEICLKHGLVLRPIARHLVVGLSF
ncbi:MAG: hypothetical protein ABUS48_04520 [Pseudomonadota bacterium]